MPAYTDKGPDTLLRDVFAAAISEARGVLNATDVPVVDLDLTSKTLKVVSDGSGRGTTVYMRKDEQDDWTPVSYLRELTIRIGMNKVMEADITVLGLPPKDAT